MASVNLPISKYHELRIVNTEVIVSALPMRQHILPLSNIDLTIQPVSLHVFFCYKSSPSPRTFASALSHLKTSLSSVLVSHYVFAGRIVIDGHGLPKINCNNKEVRLTQAYAAAPLSHLNLYKSVQGKLVPLLSKPFQEDGDPVFAVQVNDYKQHVPFSSCMVLCITNSTIFSSAVEVLLLAAHSTTELQMHTLQTCFAVKGGSF